MQHNMVLKKLRILNREGKVLGCKNFRKPTKNVNF